MPSFYSVSSHPGKTGTWFYTRFFGLHGLGHTYTAIGSSEIAPVVDRVRRDDDAAGLSVSMPFKSSVMEHLDELSPECTEHGMCNTVAKKDGRLVGYNCDHAGAMHVAGLVGSGDRVAILGNGSIGSMLFRVLHDRSPMLFSRSMGNWEERHVTADVIINATGLGTSSDDSPLVHIPEGTRMVVDLSIRPGKLSLQCQQRGVSYVGGLTFYRYQFARQYKLYTGISIDGKDLDDAAEEYARLFLA